MEREKMFAELEMAEAYIDNNKKQLIKRLKKMHYLESQYDRETISMCIDFLESF